VLVQFQAALLLIEALVGSFVHRSGSAGASDSGKNISLRVPAAQD
jgi:hypothetical protein